MKLPLANKNTLDYKFATYEDKIYKTYKIQMVLYGLLIQEVFDSVVNRGFWYIVEAAASSLR